MDEKALEAAAKAIFDLEDDVPECEEMAQAAISAYLAAAPGEYARLVERATRFLDGDDMQYHIATLSAKLAAETRRADEAERQAAIYADDFPVEVRARKSAEAELAKLRAALTEIRNRAQQPQISYDKIGPTWTSRISGAEYEDTSTYLAFAGEIVEACDAALASSPTPAQGGENE